MNDLAQYTAVRDGMKPVDVVVFSGRTPLSYAIDFVTGSNLSHIALVRQPVTHGPEADVTITESTLDERVSGPQTNPLGERLAGYGDGSQAWWLPLSDEIRAFVDLGRFYAAVGALEGPIKYDTPGLFTFLLRGLPVIGPHIPEETRRMFCSAYVVDVLEKTGVLRGIDFSAVSPQAIASMHLYKDAVQLIGPPGKIARFNEF